MHECRHHDHRPAKRPEHERERGDELESKLPADSGDDELEEDQPDPADQREGMRAFLEKRPAAFKGE